MPSRLNRIDPARPVIGWAEWISLPDLGIARLPAKVDTGAKTSALHILGMLKVAELPPISQGGPARSVVELQLPISTRDDRSAIITASAVVENWVTVRDSGGHAERRPLIETTLVIGPFQLPIQVSLTDRGDMQYPMLIGRSALSNHFFIDASQRYRLKTKLKSRVKGEQRVAAPRTTK